MIYNVVLVNLYYYVYMCVCAHVCKHSGGPEEAVRAPEVGGSSSHELPKVGAETETRVLCKRNKGS